MNELETSQYKSQLTDPRGALHYAHRVAYKGGRLV